MLRPETVLVIHESERPVKAIREVIGASGAVLQHARMLSEGMHLLAEIDPDLVFVSLELSEMEGPRVVRHLRERHPSTKVVALTADDDTGAAVASMRAGAEDYLTLPLDRDRLEQAVGRSLRDIRAARALQTTKEQMRDRYGFRDLLSRSPKMLRVFEQIRAVAPTDATVLILGETGTGKELVAHAIHDGSKRADKAYVSVNCGAFSESLLESELFGHERGSFTGAVERREGVFMMADSGTLFLDELGTTSLSLQVKLLRVLEEMQFRRLGGEKLVSVDVRIVAATNLDLEEAVAAGHFRDDLFYRLNVFPIVLPPLRERAEDIPLLLTHFVESIAVDYALTPPVIAADALACIERYAWPGNVRQLRAMCERWVILAHGRTLLKEMLPAEMQGAGAVETSAPAAWRVDEAEPLPAILGRVQEQVERAYLHKVLLRHGGHLQRTAAHVGFTRRTLYTKMKQYGMDAAEYRGRDEDA